VKLYLAAPLFNPTERAFNARLCADLEAAGHDVFLPQRDGIESEAIDASGEERMERVFELDRRGVIEAEGVVAVLDGRVPDEGVMIELGIAHEHDLPVFGLKTDERMFREDQHLNAMVYGVLDAYATDEETLLDAVEAY